MCNVLAGSSESTPPPSLALFASPDHLDPELQSFLEESSFRLCKWFAQAGKSGPLPNVNNFPNVAPSLKGLSGQELLSDIQLIMDGSYQPSHPGALAHLDPPPLTASIVADLICAGLNNNLLAEELSPSLSRLERDLCQWFCQKIGFPSISGGVAASGGTLSNLMALVVARHHANLQADPKAVVIASEESHVCLSKAVRVMGLSDDSLQRINTRENGHICLEELQKKLSILKSEGRKCFAIVATAGTTVRGAIDPLEELAEIARSQSIWFHVDGAIGGIFACAKSTSPLLKGINLADSITLNPQKLLGITKTSSLLLVANKNHLLSTFSTGLPYIEPALENPHGGEMGLQGTRSGEVLKLWLGLRQLGEEGISHLLKTSIERRIYIQRKLDSLKISVLGGPLHIISCTPRSADDLNSEHWSVITRKKLLKHNFMLSRPKQNGRFYLKIVMGNPHTLKSHLDQLAHLLNDSVVG